MPAASPPAKVLVTGANGYVATWVVKCFLDKGYLVRGTVRSLSKGAHTKKLFEFYGDKFELAVVEDITEDGAFDIAVKGVDFIAHTASPFHFRADTADELIKPAVNGTLGILNSAAKHAPTVKRVVVTSSTAAVFEYGLGPTTFNEKHWCQKSVDVVKEQGDKAPKADIYKASKTLAERAAWDFMKTKEGTLNFDLVCLNPPYVFGPTLHDVTEAANLGTSALNWFNIMAREDMGGKSIQDLSTYGSSWIDARDLGKAHVLALETEAAGGERLIVYAGDFTWQDWIDAANSLSPSPIPSHTLPKGNPGAGINYKYPVKYDSSNAAKILGITYLSMEETTRDTLEDFERRGW